MDAQAAGHISVDSFLRLFTDKDVCACQELGSLHFVFFISVTELFYSGGSGTSGVLRWDLPVYYYYWDLLDFLSFAAREQRTKT